MSDYRHADYEGDNNVLMDAAKAVLSDGQDGAAMVTSVVLVAEYIDNDGKENLFVAQSQNPGWNHVGMLQTALVQAIGNVRGET